LANAASHALRLRPTSSHHASPPRTTSARSSQGHHSVEDPAGSGDGLALLDVTVGLALGELLVGVGVGVGDVVVGVGVGVGVSVFVGVGVGVGVSVFVGVGVGVGVSVFVGVGVMLPSPVRVGVAVSVGVGVPLGVGVGVAVSLGVGVRVIEGSDTLGFVVGRLTEPEPQALSASTVPRASSAAAVRRGLMVRPPRARGRGRPGHEATQRRAADRAAALVRRYAVLTG
jgi:hypothetical protein